jgi:hypothetical protein
MADPGRLDPQLLRLDRVRRVRARVGTVGKSPYGAGAEGSAPLTCIASSARVIQPCWPEAAVHHDTQSGQASMP